MQKLTASFSQKIRRLTGVSHNVIECLTSQFDKLARFANPRLPSSSFQLFLYWIKRGNFNILITFFRLNWMKLFSFFYRLIILKRIFEMAADEWTRIVSFPITLDISNRFICIEQISLLNISPVFLPFIYVNENVLMLSITTLIKKRELVSQPAKQISILYISRFGKERFSFIIKF